MADIISMRSSCGRCSARQSGWSSAPSAVRRCYRRSSPHAPFLPRSHLSGSLSQIHIHLCPLISHFHLSEGSGYRYGYGYGCHGFIGDRNNDDCTACTRRSTVPFGRCSFLSSANYPIHYLYCCFCLCLHARTAFADVACQFVSPLISTYGHFVYCLSVDCRRTSVYDECLCTY